MLKAFENKLAKRLLMGFRPFLFAIALFITTDLFIHWGPPHLMLDQLAKNPLDIKFRELKESFPTGVDVLFLGSSKTNNGLSTDAFETAMPGVKSYNFGFPGTEYQFLDFALNEVIRLQRKPKMLVLEVSDFMLMQGFNTDDLYYSKLLGYDSRYFNHFLSNQTFSQNQKIKLLLASVSSVYRYNKILSPLMLYHLSQGNLEFMPREKMYKGWQPMTVRKMLVNPSIWSLENQANFNTKPLETILKHCQEENIPVVLVLWPDHQQYQTLFEKKSGTRYKALVSHVAQQYRVPLIDLDTSENGKMDELFADLRHLNYDGAVFFSARLGEKLKSLSSPMVSTGE